MGETLEPVAVGRLERWLGDHAIEQGWDNTPYIEPNGFRVAIVGSGPAGMACAADLARAGCEVVIYEALQVPGGVLRYGIPEFRLPNSVIDAEINNLKKLRVRIECNTLVGRLFTIEQMIKEMGFHAVFIGTGAGSPRFMGIPGESFSGVMSANELLTRCNLMQAGRFPEFDTPLHLGRRVVVIGAGNTAMDAMRVSLRLGAAKVYCVYRRSQAECPARLEELHHAEEEGVEFHWLTAPVEILGDDQGNVRGLRNIRMELGQPDESGRARPVPVAGSEYEFETDMVVYAIGTQANPDHRPDLEHPAEQMGVHCDGREPGHVPGRRLCRRRHCHRCRHGHQSHGRRAKGRGRHQGILGDCGQRLRLRPDTGKGQPCCLGSLLNKATWSVFDWTPPKAVGNSDKEACHGRA